MPKLKQTDKSTFEAAQDLGASPVYAFFKVVFPDILPGVVSVFSWPLPCLWMTLLSPILPKVRSRYPVHENLRRSPQRHPSGNVRFVHSFVCHGAGPSDPDHSSPKDSADTKVTSSGKGRNWVFRLAVTAALLLLFIGGGIGYSLKNAGNASGERLIVYNWGEYIDPEVLDMFEEETGIS